MSYHLSSSLFERYLKIAFIAGGALIAFVFLYSYVSQNARRSHASLGPESVRIEFSDINSPAGTPTNRKVVGVTMTPVDTTKKISAFDLRLTGTNLKIISATDPVGFSDKIFKTITDTTLRATYTVGTSGLPQSSAFFSIVVESMGVATGTLTVNKTDSEIVGTLTKIKFDLDTDAIVKTITFATGGTPIPTTPVTPIPTTPVTPIPTTPVTPIPTQPPGNGEVSAVLHFAVRAQGILKKPNIAGGELFNVWLVGPTNVGTTVVLTPDGNGIYLGKANVSLIPGKYTLYIKGPRHLKKRVCHNTPKETSIGTYRCSLGNVNLTGGPNTLDFTAITLLTGDLPAQDGVVDSYDISFVRQSLGSTDSGKVTIGDINRDGIVDTQDMSLIIQSLNIKYDEE